MPTDQPRHTPPTPSGGLTVRRFERHELALPIKVSIDETGPVAVKLSRSSGAMGAFYALLSDVGQGGLGVESPHFLPRQTTLRVRLYADNSVGLPEFDARVRVMRSRMSSREPRYALGCSFVDPTPKLQQAVEDVLAASAAARNADGEAA